MYKKKPLHGFHIVSRVWSSIFEKLFHSSNSIAMKCLFSFIVSDGNGGGGSLGSSLVLSFNGTMAYPSQCLLSQNNNNNLDYNSVSFNTRMNWWGVSVRWFYIAIHEQQTTTHNSHSLYFTLLSLLLSCFVVMVGWMDE